MERIKINNINKKDSGLVIVKYNDDKEATMQTRWQAQEVDYLEKDVGIGGTVLVLIQQKGDYTNITKVDFSSAEKGNKVENQEIKTATLMSVKDIRIISQCLTKAWAAANATPREVLEAYRYFVLELEQNG